MAMGRCRVVLMAVGSKGVTIGFDAPKSVSLAYELGGDDRVLDAFRQSVAETMGEIETEAKTRVRKGGREEDRVTGNMLWAEHVHRTTRPVDGVPDPVEVTTTQDRVEPGEAVKISVQVADTAFTDVNDSIGTMLMFPFTTLNWSLHTWAYAATVKGGKYLDAAAYYSSLGFAMDVFWLAVVLVSWRCLTREFWRTNVVPADARIWSWLGQWFDDRGLLAIYRGVFFYGVCRLIAWTSWAHFVAEPVLNGVKHHGYPWDLSWTGPWWVQRVTLPQVSVWIVAPFTLALLGLVYWTASLLWDRMEPPNMNASASLNERR
jgi:hypothetical protein